ncbi:RNA 2'-phosphotransferase [Bartonella sp. LJL80]
MNKIERENISKFLSFVLRHQPEAINISLDREGWTDIDILIKQAAVYGKSLTLNLIRDVVNSNDKRRFELSDHGDFIRTVQGHSTKTVARVFEPKSPPALLYHGTARRFLDLIAKDGLSPMSRHHVHLSADEATANDVGKRYGDPVVLTVDAHMMFVEGYRFFQSKNGVWLTERVPVQYIKI